MGAMILYILLTSVGIVVVIAGPHGQPFVICEQPATTAHWQTLKRQ